jgi:two-component system sensor histidine kinase HydH
MAASPPLDLELLPVAACATRDGVFVGVNRSFEELTGWTAEHVVGRTFNELLAQLVAPRDHAILERLSKNRTGPEPQRLGSLWCRMLSREGEERPMRIEWRLDDNGHDMVAVLLDARPEAFGQEGTSALARAAGALSRCATEEEVLERAVDTLCERGFTVTVLLWDANDPLLRYGPHRTPDPSKLLLDSFPRPAREVLARLNPGFFERRAAFFQDGTRLVREAYPESVAEGLRDLLPAQRMVQAPLFIGDEPYGALVVTSDALNPLLATALDIFGELVGKAIEAIRLRQERVDRERLAALGEAAAVMAHEVRNPVAAIKNALVLLERDGTSGPDGETLLSIISEEATRLAQLVNQLLELGRPLLPRPSLVPLEEVVDRAVYLLRTRGELGTRVLALPSSEGTTTWLDPVLAELAIVNVIQNALQSTTGGGDVKVLIESTESLARCIVLDEGPGIADAIRGRLGQPFVTTRATGTGMGLAVVRRIMDASEGRVSIDREEPRGTRVTLEFPRFSR